MSTFASLIDACEEDLRQGNIDSVACRLRDVVAAKVPRQERRALANICRRAGLVPLGLKMLRPKAESDFDEWKRQADAAELAEYAVLLQRIGSVNEALNLLDSVDETAVPDVHLYRAYCRFNRWEYEESIPSLEKYLRTSVTDYKKLIGRVNLAAALTETRRHDEALPVLESLIEETTRGNFQRLRANSLEIRAQILIHRMALTEADRDLEAAAEILRESKTIDQIFVQKWKAVIGALESNSTEALIALRGEAVARREWETVRDVDFYALKVAFDEAVFDHLIFGTPFQTYRARICAELQRQPTKTEYVYGSSSGPCLDIVSFDISQFGNAVPGGKTHQLIAVLLRDFYRPLPLGSLFAELFPGEYFDIHSSPDRVHQTIRRARLWLKKTGIPVEIAESSGSYSIRFTGNDFSFRVPLERRQPVNRVHLLSERLDALASDDRLYSGAELRKLLEIEQSRFLRFAAQAIEAGRLVRLGSGPSTRYRVSKASGRD